MNPLLPSLLCFAPVLGTPPAAPSFEAVPREVVHEVHVAADALELQSVLVLPRFDPSRGTLTHVEIELGLAVDGAVALENTGPEVAAANVGLLARLRAQVPGAASPAFVPIDARADLFLAGFDGVRDFGGSSGRVLPAALASHSIYSTESGLDVFRASVPSGEDPNGAYFTLPVALRGDLRVDGVPSCAMRAAWYAEVVVRVRYVYTPA